jgi:hypothetical protein
MLADDHAAEIVVFSGNFLIALDHPVARRGGDPPDRKYGLDPQSYVDFLTDSLFSAPVFKTYGGLIASGDSNLPV